MDYFDLVITNGRILDGCGNPWYWGDLGIRDGHICEIAARGNLTGKEIIDASGRYVSPGFIDIHTHSDLSILINRRAESVIRQGVTTHVIGNCGMSAAPVDDIHLAELKHNWGSIAEQPEISWTWRTYSQYLQYLQEGGISINIAALAGHAAIRIAVIGLADREVSEIELSRMKYYLVEAMQAGCFGMSTGLVYPPGCFASTYEIIELCKVVSQFQGLYTSHIRGERETVLEAVAEAILIGREANLPVQISHNAPKYGAPCDATATLRLVEQAREQGQDITVDNDLHTDLAPALISCLPQAIQDLSLAEIKIKLDDPVIRNTIKQEIIQDTRPAFGPAGLIKHGQWQRITILHSPTNPEIIGKTIEEIARERNHAPFDVYFDLILENGFEVEAIFDYIDESNIRILLRHPAVMVCSDGEVLAPYGFLNTPPPYSPCSYGEFPYLLERYVRDEGVIILQEAIRKITSFPAQRLGLTDRGFLRPGAWADIVIFDLERVHDRATNLFPYHFPLDNYPHTYPEGIDAVFVNGIMVVDRNEHTGAMPGKVLRKRQMGVIDD